MESYESHKVVKVFLASPGDVPEERAVAKQVVQDLSNIFRTQGWHIDLTGWETIPPGYGRPQEIINRYVRECSLFVGILYRKLGTPAGKGKTGFEEEMALVLKRRKTSDQPEISLFVKEVDQLSMNDPGEELQRVLKYKETIEKTRKVLYKGFTTTSEFADILRNTILSYTINAFGRNSDPEDSSSANSALPASPNPNMVALSGDNKDRDLGCGQLYDALARLSRSKEGTNDSPDLMDVVRIYLFSSSALADRNRAALMGVHEINDLYTWRKQLKLAGNEGSYILRTILADYHSFKPGWAILANEIPTVAASLIFEITVLDSDAEVRVGALNLLAGSDFDLKYSDDQRRYYIQAILEDKELRTKKPAIKLAIRIVRIEDIPTLDLELKDNPDSDIRETWLKVKLAVLAREEPEQAFGIYLDQGTKREGDYELYIILSFQVEKVPSLSLRAALALNGTGAQELAVLELGRREELSEEDLTTLIRSPSKAIREMVASKKLKRGESVEISELNLEYSQNRSLAMEEFSSGTAEELMETLSWYDFHNETKYRTLAFRHFEKFASILRRDLDDDFKEYKKSSEKKFKEYWNVPVGLVEGAETYMNEILALFNRPDSLAHDRAKLTRIAMEAISRNPQPRDVEIARRHVVKKDYLGEVQVIAGRILSFVGTSSDAEILFEAATEAYGEIKKTLSDYALALSPGADGIVKRFLASSDPEMNHIAVAALVSSGGKEIRQLFTEKLNDQNMEIRRAAVSYLCQACTREELEQILDAYISQASYFYNVVTWIDRILYAPTPFAAYFRSKVTDFRPRHQFHSLLD